MSGNKDEDELVDQGLGKKKTTGKKETIEIRIDNLEKSVGKVAYPFITGSIFLYLAVLSAAVFIVGLVSEKVIFYPISMLAFFLSAYVVIAGFLTVKEKEKPVVERLGKYWKILRPGPNIIIPLIDKIAYNFDTRATATPLFEEINGSDKRFIDFKDSAEESVDFGAYLVVTDAYRAAYFTADDVYAFAKNIIENIAKRVFGETVIDDAIENKIKVRDGTNQYLSDPMEELSKSLDSDFLRILGISRDEAKKLSPNKILRIAGVAVTNIWFNDIGLGETTKTKRAELLKIRLDEKIAQGKERVEKANVGVEKQKARQVEVIESGIGTGRRRKWDIMTDGTNVTHREAMQYDIEHAKYSEGVDEISEINIQGGDGSSESAATTGTIIGKTFAKASGDKKRTPKPKEGDEEPKE